MATRKLGRQRLHRRSTFPGTGGLRVRDVQDSKFLAAGDVGIMSRHGQIRRFEADAFAVSGIAWIEDVENAEARLRISHIGVPPGRRDATARLAIAASFRGRLGSEILMISNPGPGPARKA